MKTCRRFSPVVRTAMKSGAKKRPRKRLQGPETKRMQLSNQEQKTASGMALILVLWIVAALSLMVASMSQSVRQHIKVAASVSDQARARALAEGAITLVLQQMKAESTSVQTAVTAPVEYDGVAMQVQVMPLSGLIPLNTASHALLTALLHIGGGMQPPQAVRLAQDIVNWRNGQGGDPTRRVMPRQFEAPEDLLQVPGIDYALYERLRPLVTVDGFYHSSVNPLAAPLPVLTVLAHGNATVAERIASRRDANEAGVDLTGLDPALLGGSGADLYRVTASVPLDAGRIFSLSHDVMLTSFSSQIAPWRVLRTDWQIR